MLPFSELVLSEMRRKWIMVKVSPHLLLKMTLSDLKEVIVTQKGKIFFVGYPFVSINKYAAFLLYVMEQPFVAKKAAKGCPSTIGILRGSLLRYLLLASVAYILLVT